MTSTYKVYRVQEPDEWGCTVHILTGESWDEISEEITAEIIPLLDDEIKSAADFWSKAYVECLGTSPKRGINPSEWAYKPPLTRREVDTLGNVSWVSCYR